MAEAEVKREIELLIYHRDNIVENIDELHNLAESLSIEASTECLTEFKVRCDEVKAHYETFERSQSDLASLYLQQNEPEQLANIKGKNRNVKGKYFYILAAKERHLSQTSAKEVHSSDNTSTSSSVRLPKINLPTFEGPLKQWPNFKDLFIALVHSNRSMSDIEKFHFLISCTKGEPNNLVRSLPLSATNYVLAWNQLNDRYDNKRMLADQYIEEILNAPSVKYESPKLIRNLLDLVTENTLALKSMDIPEDLGNFMILHVILRKLDKHTRQLFERKFSSNEYPQLDQLLEFLREHAKSLDAAESTVSSKDSLLPPRFKPANNERSIMKPANFFNPMSKRALHTNAPVQPPSFPPVSCLFCNQNHNIYQCTTYLKLPVSQRRDFIKSKEACFNCLNGSHMLSQCKSTRTCFKCKRSHHTSLHEDNFSSRTPPSKPAEADPSSANSPPQSTVTFTSHVSEPCNLNPTTTLLGTALIQLQDSSGQFQFVRCLIDSGSQSSFITEECVSRLCLSRRKHRDHILGLSETAITGQKGIVHCKIKSRLQKEPTLTTNAIILNRITSSLPSVTLNHRVKEYFKNWELADPQFDVPGKIDFLIGADLFSQLFDGGRFETPLGLPTAFRTIFGWLLLGETSLPSPAPPVVSVHFTTRDQQSLDSTLKRFWEVEEPPMAKRFSPEDEKCEEIYMSTVKRQPSGRFVVDLPFRSNPPSLGDSYEKAHGCFISLERKFNQNPDLQASYCQFMKEYEDLGHMSKVNSNEIQGYYIPHHGIFKNTNASKPKLRVVFNASAQTTSGLSLNDELLVGPKLQSDICKVLTLFRLHTYVFTTDVEKMYRQILINPEQRKYQAILWRNKVEEPISTYLLNTVTYGVTASPYLALRTLQQLALDHSTQFPLASEAVLNATFVDDILTGADSIKCAANLKSELVDLLHLGGFELRKWSSNSPELLMDVPTHHQELVFQENKMDSPSIKVLGLKWSPITDVFSYDVHLDPVLPTKRNILSQVSRVYDPLGLITPVVLWAKCLIQKMWLLGLDWDQPLPHDLANQSLLFFQDLPRLSQLAIPRLVLPTDHVTYQLHGFCDGSLVAFGCTVYLRTIQSNGNVTVHLLMAKSKVAPLKTLSIPRLELSGALLLCKTLNYCQTLLTGKLKNIPIYAWSDSMIILYWLRSPPHQLKTFVANRVAQIQSCIDPSSWRHTPTASNPADSASRGLLPTEILNNSLWWNGPEWLKEDETHWPTQRLSQLPTDDTLAEYRPTTALVTQNTEPPTSYLTLCIKRFSNFRKLQACFGWVLRFINNCRRNKTKIGLSFLTAQERLSSLHHLTKIVQSEHFNEYFPSIFAKKPTPPFLQRLDPFLDDLGVVRVGGRLRNAPIKFDARHPLLLPKHSHLTHLLIDYFHIKYLHAGPRALQSLLSQQFWIISARQVIRNRILNCVSCTRFRGQSIQPYMGNLPAARLSQTRPFLSVGVDFGGPYLTKTGTTRKPQLLKSYICLFVCFSTKAVHLELVSSLSTDAFLAALDRFVSRRGIAAHIYSDQGTNFIGADRELKELYSLLTQPESSTTIFSRLSALGITWHFNPPAAPHFGGLWESGIKSTKYHLKRSLGSQVLNFEEFTTVLTKIEAILNSRPLCSLSSDPNELNTLTPGHFLIGEPLVALPQLDYTATNMNRLSRWQLVQQAQRSFWSTWNKEYLHQLQQRPKWTRLDRNLQVGDLVLVKEKNLPPLSWMSGRVVKIYPGEDGVVRVVTLKTPTGHLKRSVNLLVPLLKEDQD